jgi:hypothetical protein
MLGHARGFKLANDGQDTRALQHYLGHKNIQHTVRYTELSPRRFRDFWKDCGRLPRAPKDGSLGLGSFYSTKPVTFITPAGTGNSPEMVTRATSRR